MTEACGRIAGIYPLVGDDPRWTHPPRDLVEAALAGGATILQLRLEHAPDREALELCRWAAGRAHEAGALLIVNNRFDLADLGGADGVHLGQDDLPPERIPREIRRRLLVGLSTHTQEQVRASRHRPVDYIAFGPVFGTRSKATAYDARGVGALAQAVREAGRPVVAIGGIDTGNVGEVATAGARAAAVIAAIAGDADPAGATRRLGERFMASTGG